MKQYGMEVMLPSAHRAFPSKRFYSRKRGEAMVTLPGTTVVPYFETREVSSLCQVRVQASHPVSVALKNMAGTTLWSGTFPVGSTGVAFVDGAIMLPISDDPKQSHCHWRIMQLKGKGSVYLEASAKYLVYDTEDHTPNRE